MQQHRALMKPEILYLFGSKTNQLGFDIKILWKIKKREEEMHKPRLC